MGDAMNLHQLVELRAAFEQADVDGGGSLDVEEFIEAFGSVLGRNMTREKLALLFMKIDANSDGSVDWDEFINFVLLENKAAANAPDAGSSSFRFALPLPQGGNSDRSERHAHSGMVERLLVLPRGLDKCVSGSRDGTVRVWHTGSLAHLRTVRVSEAWVSGLAYFERSNRIAVSSIDRSLSFLDGSSLEPIGHLGGLEASPLCLSAWHKHGCDRLLVGDDVGAVSLYAAEGDTAAQSHLRVHRLQRDLRHDDWVTKVCYYDDLNALVSASLDGTVKIGDLERAARGCHQELVELERSGGASSNARKGVYSFDWSPTYRLLAASGVERLVSLWNPYTSSDRPLGTLAGHNASVSEVFYHHQQHLLISCSVDKVAKLWDLRMQRCLQTIHDDGVYRPEDRLSAFAFDEARSQLLTAATAPRAWPLVETAMRAATAGHDAPVIAALYNVNFAQVVSGDESGRVCVWDLSDGSLAFRFHAAHGAKMTCMSFDEAGRRLLTSGNDGVVRVWNFSNGQCLKALRSEASAESSSGHAEVSCLLFLLEGPYRHIVAGGWSRKVLVWKDTRSVPGGVPDDPDRELAGHAEDITAVSFGSPNLLATGGYDGVVLLWNLDSGVVRHSLAAPAAATPREDEARRVGQRAVWRLLFLGQRSQTLCACGADGWLRFWNPKDGEAVWEQHAGHEGEGLVALATDPANALLFTGDTAGCIKAWDVSRFVNVPRLDQSAAIVETYHWSAHESSVSSLEVMPRRSATGTGAGTGTGATAAAGAAPLLLSAGADACIKVWHVAEDGTPWLAATFGGPSGGHPPPWALHDPTQYRAAAPIVPQRAKAEVTTAGAMEVPSRADAGDRPRDLVGGSSGEDPAALRAARLTSRGVMDVLTKQKAERAGGALAGGRRGAAGGIMHRLHVHDLGPVTPRTPRCNS